MYPYKNKNLEVNIQAGSINKENYGTLFYSEDKGTASIRIKITDNGRVIDFNTIDLIPSLDLFMADGSIFIDEPLSIVAPQYGQVQYDIPDNIIDHTGKVNVKLLLKNATKSIHVADFNFTIGNSGIEDAVEKEVSVNIVDDAVRRIIAENAIQLLGEGFKDDVAVELQNYVSTNNELFKGDKGDIGPKGLIGPRGDKGDTGLQGLRGLQGAKGDTGPQGLKGIQGVAGPQGFTGEQGEKGPQGLQGVKGDRGDTGATGVQGIKGDTGPQGLKGIQGVKGDKGDTGPQGIAGTDAYIVVSATEPAEGNVWFEVLP